MWLKRMREGAELGHPGGQWNLAEDLMKEAPKGPKGDEDRAEARKWIWEAARFGHTYAMRQVGDWYRDGDGVPADRIEAGRWYLRAWIVNEWHIPQGFVNTILKKGREDYAVEIGLRMGDRHTEIGYPAVLM